MRTIIVLSFLSNAFYRIECKCDSFKNANVTAIPANGKPYSVTVNGCMRAGTFGETRIRGVYAKRQYIPYLEADSIKDMYHLEAVSFDECSMKRVEPGAFRNVPRLLELYLVKSYISEIFKGVFNDLTLLYKIRLDNNSISFIEKQAFSGLRALRKIHLAHNKLAHWDQEWFTNSTNIRKINLGHNLIEKIPTHAFRYLPNLKKINFNYNNIFFIEAGAFQGIRHLEYLGLRYNRISVIDPEIFPNPIQIDSLFIDANQMNYIPRLTFARLTVKNITIDGNPWGCMCLTEVSLWLGITNGRVKSSKHCRGGETYQCVHLHDTCSEKVDNEVTNMYFNVVRHRIENNTLSNKCVRIY